MSAIKVAGGALAAALVAITTYAVPSSASATAEPEAAAPPGTIRIETINGSGCPAGTAWAAMNSGNNSFNVSYSDYVAIAGGQANPTEFRKNCQLNLRLDAPSGYRYAIQSVEYHGFAFLDDDARGLMQAGYYFQGSSETEYESQEFDGPYNSAWEVTHRVDGLDWSGCGQQPNLNINSELRVYAGDDGATSLMAMDSTRGSARTTYNLVWEEC